MGHYFYGSDNVLVILTADVDGSTWINMLENGILATSIYHYINFACLQAQISGDFLLLVGKKLDNSGNIFNIFDLKNWTHIFQYPFSYDEKPCMEVCDSGILILDKKNLYFF